MNGIHDMGGMDGFGKVEPEANEPVFHAAWEARVLALNRAMGASGVWNIDLSRYSRETLAPDVYLASSYYRKWYLGLEQMLLERALVDADEIATGHSLSPGKPLPRKLTAADIERVLTRGSFGRPARAPARFGPGDRVRARNINPPTHTRLPRYARGRGGIVERVQGCHVFPDTAAAGQGEHPQWLYTVCFEARELWGEDADATVTVSIEAFEPYLEPA
jgi:nitrile hydratase